MLFQALAAAALFLAPAATSPDTGFALSRVPAITDVLTHNVKKVPTFDAAFVARSNAYHAALGTPVQRFGLGHFDPRALDATVLQGEVIVMEADDMLVSSDGAGSYSIRTDGDRQDTLVITTRAIQAFGDEFDFICVFTMFTDGGAPGALAYEMSAANDVQGIGSYIFDDSAAWGSRGKLKAFLNMMYVFQWDDMSAEDNFLYPVWGQEAAHRWLSFMRYRRADGSLSEDLLGRDGSHWSALVDAEGSVMDGMDWEPQADGTFTMTKSMYQFSPLDQYAMGLRRADEVPPFFLLENAVSTRTGNTFTPTTRVADGANVRASKSDITIEQIIAAEGPRLPTPNEAPRDFRMAVVLVTQPGQTREDTNVVLAAQNLETARQIWERKFVEFTGGRGTMCTAVSAPCNAPSARLAGGTVTEVGDGDGILEPREQATVKVTIRNTGVGEATGVTANLTAPTGIQVAPAEVAVPAIPAGGMAEVEFTATLSEIACGEQLTFQAESHLGMRTFVDQIDVTPGVATASLQDLEAAVDGWRVNPAGDDTAAVGAWELGTPEGVEQYRVTYQPGAAHSGTRAWVTGLGAGSNQSANDLDGGQTTLETERFSVEGVVKPTLRYWMFFTSYEDNAPSSRHSFRVLASADDATWTEIDLVSGPTGGWVERKASLEAVAAGATHVRFRFVATDVARLTSLQGRTNVVEGGVDDVRITGDSDGCQTMGAGGMAGEGGAGGAAGMAGDGAGGAGGGTAGTTGGAAGRGGRSGGNPGTDEDEEPAAKSSGCALGGHGPSGSLALLALASLALFRRRRR